MFLTSAFRAVVRDLEGAPGSPVWTLALKAKLAGEIALNPSYFTHVVLPAAKATIIDTGIPLLPMIEPEQSKGNAIHRLFWGLLFENWVPEGASSLFLRDLTGRGPGNRRKKLFAAGVTPDRYAESYKPKIDAFHARVFAPDHEDRPFMQAYLAAFLDLYWDLHLGVSGAAIPDAIRDIYASFVAVFAIRDPFSPAFYEHYMNVRHKRPVLMAWIADRMADLSTRPGHEHTFVHAWQKSADEDCFTQADIAFECYSDFLAMSQWPQAAALVTEALASNPAWLPFLDAAGSDRNALRPIVMELFRLVCPNEASFSPVSLHGAAADVFGLELIIAVSHRRACRDPRLWTDPDRPDPSRFAAAPTSDRVDAAYVRSLGLTCPFPPTPVDIPGHPGLQMTNSAFGTVYGVLDGEPHPVCDHAGFAPFGFGYRRCPGEHLTLALFTDFLLELHQRNLVFVDLGEERPPTVIVGPVPPVLDRYGFVQRLPAAAALHAEQPANV